jgi:hypothetical protein
MWKKFLEIAYFRAMKLFRDHLLGRFMAIFTGILFLNLSFILTEIHSFDLKAKNSQLYDNIVKMVCGIGAEEERDIMGESDSLEKEANLLSAGQIIFIPDLFLISKELHQTSFSPKLLSGNSEITTPPPKQV